MAKKLTSVSKIIEAFGGRRSFAKLLHTTPQAVDNWRRANALPSNTFIIMQIQMDIIGATAPVKLWGMRGVPTWKRRR